MGCPQGLRTYPSNLIRVMPAKGWIQGGASAALFLFMDIIVNGSRHAHRGNGSLGELLKELDAQPDQVAIVVNDRIVSKNERMLVRLRDGDRVEIGVRGGRMNTESKLTLGGVEFDSRLLMGTGKFASSEMMSRAIEAAGAQLVTVALRRFNPGQPSDDLLSPLRKLKITLVPNTSGARNAAEAVRAAMLSRGTVR